LLAAVGRRLTSEEVEAALVAHYLSTDGPYGTGPLTHIDASDATLQEAFQCQDPKEALVTLVHGCESDLDVAHFLERGWCGHWSDANAPGFFRFLVLTCAVVADADRDAESQEFGHNLQRLLQTSRTFNIRSALPPMWRSLKEWCEKRRSEGAPIRRLVLPDPGDGVHLGLTNAISFPSWRDFRDLKREIGGIPKGRLSDPSRVAINLCHRVTVYNGFRKQMEVSARDFYAHYQESASLLHLHPFWMAVQRALGAAPRRSKAQFKEFRIELQGSGLPEETQILFAWSVDEWQLQQESFGGVPSAVSWLRERASASPILKAWHDRISTGAVAFMAERVGSWEATMKAPGIEAQWLYLVSATVYASIGGGSAQWQRTEWGDWLLVGPVVGAEAARLHRLLRLDTRAPAHAAPMQFIGGVVTAAGWLGCSSLLPDLQYEGSGTVAVTPCEGSGPIPSLRVVERGRLRLESEEHLDGFYRLSLHERAAGARTLESERVCRFTKHAPEHSDLVTQHRRFVREAETLEAASVVGSGQVVLPPAEPTSPVTEAKRHFEDLLELIYARGRRGWGERDLIEAIRSSLPAVSPWDVARSLRECRWLTRARCTSWNASMWCLCPPILHRVPTASGEAVVLTGSAPRVIQDRFVASARRLGGHTVSIPGVGAIAPSTFVAVSVDCDALSRELGWPVLPWLVAGSVAAPHCWSNDRADPGQHRLRQAWDWNAERFAECSTAEVQRSLVSLTLWKRPNRPDEHDIYVVRSASTASFQTYSRTVALLEAYRRAKRQMFTYEGQMLWRDARCGHLPDHLASSLFRATLRAAGLVEAFGGWRYAYPCNAAALLDVQSCLGRAFVDVSSVSPSAAEPEGGRLSPLALGWARHRGPRHLTSVRRK
jgi:hypothetical protein